MEEELIDAAIECDIDKFRILLSSSDRCEISTLLHKLLDGMREWRIDLSEKEILSIFTALRDAGVDPDALDESGRSPLVIFLDNYEYQHIPRLLVEVMGADPNKTATRDLCLTVALSNKDDCHAFDLLLELGCEPPSDERYTHLLFFSGEKESDFYEEMLRRLLDMGLILVNERDSELNTPLHCAMMELEVLSDPFSRKTKNDLNEEEEQLADNLATLLLAHGADPFAENMDSETPLDIWNDRMRDQMQGDTDDVEERLLNAQADALDRLDVKKFEVFVQVAGARRLGKSICNDLIKPLVLVPNPRGHMSERRKLLETMLDAEGIYADGIYYENCLRGIEAIDICEFRLRHIIATEGVPEYHHIIQRLRRRNEGRYYTGIHAQARELFKAHIIQRGVRLEDPL